MSQPGMMPRPDYTRFELTVVPVEDNLWRAFPTRVDRNGVPAPVGLQGYFDLPTMPTRELALEMGCLMIWGRLDDYQIYEGFDQVKQEEIWVGIDELA